MYMFNYLEMARVTGIATCDHLAPAGSMQLSMVMQ